VAEPTVADSSWRTIDELGSLVGAYCWVERRLFEVTGAWASEPTAGEAQVDPADGELRLWCAATSRRHGALASRWAERLPVRAGVDAAALVAPPERPAGLVEGFEELAGAQELAIGFGALVESVLPWVVAVYGTHLAVASPVAEASVMEVLAAAGRGGRAEIRNGRFLLERLEGAGTPSRHLGKTLERAFDDRAVRPGVRPA
jgi:hypothetical protein